MILYNYLEPIFKQKKFNKFTNNIKKLICFTYFLTSLIEELLKVFPKSTYFRKKANLANLGFLIYSGVIL